jgi:hypothetical protein
MQCAQSIGAQGFSSESEQEDECVAMLLRLRSLNLVTASAVSCLPSCSHSSRRVAVSNAKTDSITYIKYTTPRAGGKRRLLLAAFPFSDFLT